MRDEDDGVVRRLEVLEPLHPGEGGDIGAELGPDVALRDHPVRGDEPSEGRGQGSGDLVRQRVVVEGQDHDAAHRARDLAALRGRGELADEHARDAPERLRVGRDHAVEAFVREEQQVALPEGDDVGGAGRVVHERHLAGHRAVPLLPEHDPLAVLPLEDDLEPPARHEVHAVGRIALPDDDVARLGGAEAELAEQQVAHGVGQRSEDRRLTQEVVHRGAVEGRIRGVARAAVTRMLRGPPLVLPCTETPPGRTLPGSVGGVIRARDGERGAGAARGGRQPEAWTMSTTTSTAPPPASRVYRALKGLAWIVISVFYRRIDVTGDGGLARAGSSDVVVANHTEHARRSRR